MERMRRSVVVLGFPGIQSLDVTGPFDVLATATLLLTSADRGYDIAVHSIDGQPLTTWTGLEFGTRPLPAPGTEIDTILIPGGPGVDAARAQPEVIDWLVAAAPHARRIVTVCTGAFIAATAGLLDGCAVTTHWSSADRLANEFPDIDVQSDPIYLRGSDSVWTSAGVTAGIDLALALVEDDFGVDLAMSVARWLVLYLRRPGGQTQFAPPVWMPRAKREPIRDVQSAIETNPGASHSIADLAARVAMSPRHFTRVFTDEIGESPGSYVERIRTDAARRQLEESDDTIAVVAARCGFGSAETLRRNFVRRIGVSPDTYRKTFTAPQFAAN